MYEHKLEKEIWCPIEYGLDVFGGKWKSRIICVIAANGIIRYNALRRELTNVTDAVLAAILQYICQWSKNYTEVDKEKILSSCKTCSQF